MRERLALLLSLLPALFLCTGCATGRLQAAQTPSTAFIQENVPNADEQLKILATKLNLTDDQQARIKPILQGVHDATVKLSQDQYLSREERLARVRPILYKAHEQIGEILTGEQKKQLDQYTFALDWGITPRTGPYRFAPSLSNFTVDAPDGRRPSLTDLRSLRYHHHTRVAVDAGGRVWVAYSGNLSGEDQSGEITEISSSADDWRTSTGPIIAVAPQSPFTTDSYPGMRISYPRAFVRHEHDLYLVAAIDAKAGPGDTQTGLALIAVRCMPDGSIGSPFLVSPASGYQPLHGHPSYPYDSTFGPALFPDANNLGVWGGSQVGYPPSRWTGFTTENNTPNGPGVFVEPATVYLSSDRMHLYRLWRCTSGFDVFWLYASQSFDGGHSWSPLIRTNIPNAPSSTAMIRLTDGRIALVGNPRSSAGGVQRDPLYLAIIDGSLGSVEQVYAVRQGLAGRPAIPNGQSGGAQYPGLWQSGNTLWISYSIAKQQIGVTSVVLP